MDLWQVCAGSNTVHAYLPSDMDSHTATAMFSQFGEVSYLEAVPGEALTFAVVFFDVRAADLALNTLGQDMCWPAPQRGSRCVQLPGCASLDLHDVQGVSGVYPDGTDDGAFVVEFFDIRGAIRMHQEMELLCGTCLATTRNEPDLGAVETIQSSALEAQADAEATKKTVPAYVVPTGIVSECVLQEEKDVAVSMTGLPNLIVTEPCMQAMLQQAGLKAASRGFEAKPGDPCGEAVIHFGSREAADMCVRYFHGCQWDPSGTEVSARIVEESQCGCLETELSVRSASTSLPAKVRGAGWAAASSAEESTEAGPSEGEDET